jgi:CheY-like chemotaxis protein
MPSQHAVTIVLVEDDPGHARLIERNLRRASITNEIVVLGDGRQALDFLFSEGTHAGDPRPNPFMVLLDLNLPGVSGYQILERLKGDPKTHRIPVVVLTTTDDRREVTRCYELGCNVYMTKPVDYDQFSQAIAKLGLFLSVVAVPDGERDFVPLALAAACSSPRASEPARDGLAPVGPVGPV